MVRRLTVRNLHWHNRHATLFERKHKIVAFADDIKWAGENGLAASLKVGWVAVTKLSFSRRVDWRRVDFREKRDCLRVCVQVANSNALGISHGAKITN